LGCPPIRSNAEEKKWLAAIPGRERRMQNLSAWLSLISHFLFVKLC
jgi:hypothetical protein